MVDIRKFFAVESGGRYHCAGESRYVASVSTTGQRSNSLFNNGVIKHWSSSPTRPGSVEDVWGPNGPIQDVEPAIIWTSYYARKLDSYDELAEPLKLLGRIMCRIRLLPELRAGVEKVTGYKNHLKDPEYIRLEIHQINGMLSRWRMGVMDLFATTAPITSSFDIEDEDTYPPQFLFAKHHVPELMESIASFDVFPVSCLNVHVVLQF